MISQRAVVEFRKFTDGMLDAGADSHGPKDAVLTELQAAIVSLFEKLLDFVIGSAGKEKNVVEIALPGKLGLFLGKPRVLDELARGERAQSHSRHARIPRECLQGLSGRWQDFSDRNTCKAAKAQRGGLVGPRGAGCGSQVEIVLRKINCAAIFRDKGMSVAMFAAGIVELKTRAAGQPNGGNGFVVESRGEFIETLEAGSPQGDQCINSDVEDARSLTQTGLRTGEAYSTGIRKITCAPQKKGGQIVLPAFSRPANSPGPLLEKFSCQTLPPRMRPSANSPL